MGKRLWISVIGLIIAVIAGIIFSILSKNVSKQINEPTLENKITDVNSGGDASVAEEKIADIDSDNNGVWDYIDKYINTKYPGPDNNQLRSASRQYARAIQGGLLNADNKEISLQYATASTRATECVFYLRPQDASGVLSDLEAVILNTMTRSRAFLRSSEQSAGGVFPIVPFSQRSTSCIAD